MNISDEHIDFINKSLELHGVKSKSLREDLVDHICSYIEQRNSDDFDFLYHQALNKFGGYTSFKNLELETNYQKTGREIIKINKLKFVFGFLVILCSLMALVFLMMQWPYANAWLLVSFAISIFFLLPAHLYEKHKKSIHKFSN